MREGALEILALLLLGFIAMLAIVPPIIRGKLEDSPLVTTQTFQRSMQEIAHSLEPRLQPHAMAPENRAGGLPAGSARTTPAASAGKGTGARPVPDVRVYPRPSSSRPDAHAYTRRASARKAAIRKNRIFAFLTCMVLTWGMVTLFTGSPWCLVMFSASGFLLAFYWGLTIVVPYLLMRSGETRREDREVSAARRRRIA